MPTIGYNVGGWRRTGAIRVRSFLLLWQLIEEQWENQGGSREWRRIDYPVTLVPASDRD